MKRFVLAIALACALSSTALAGEVPTTGVTTPEPPNPVVAVILAIISTVL